MALVSIAAVAAIGAGSAAAGSAVAGGVALYKKKKARQQHLKQLQIIEIEHVKHKEMQELSIEELSSMKQNDPFVLYELGLKYSDPLDIERCLRAASDKGHSLSAYQLGKYHFSGDILIQSNDIALDFYLFAADKGLSDAAIAAGDIYYSQENWKEARKLYKRALVLGNEVAEIYLLNTKLQLSDASVICEHASLMLRNGADINEAIKWYEKAVDMGNSDASYWLGIMYLEGNGVEKNEDKGMMLLLQAAGDGNYDAGLYLADEYEKKGMYDNAILRLQMLPKKTTITDLKIDNLKKLLDT